jgi:hypothetical protein
MRLTFLRFCLWEISTFLVGRWEIDSIALPLWSNRKIIADNRMVFLGQECTLRSRFRWEDLSGLGFACGFLFIGRNRFIKSCFASDTAINSVFIVRKLKSLVVNKPKKELNLKLNSMQRKNYTTKLIFSENVSYFALSKETFEGSYH